MSSASTPGGEELHVRPAPDTATCDVHAWPTMGLPGRLVTAMRERHGKGGVNVCRECVMRAYDEAKRIVGRREEQGPCTSKR